MRAILLMIIELLIVFLYSFFLQCQALSLLLAMILRGMVSTRKADYDVEDEYDARSRTREPLLNQQSSQASGSTKGDGRGTHSDIWSSRIRDKVFCGNSNHNLSSLYFDPLFFNSKTYFLVSYFLVSVSPLTLSGVSVEEDRKGKK